MSSVSAFKINKNKSDVNTAVSKVDDSKIITLPSLR